MSQAIETSNRIEIVMTGGPPFIWDSAWHEFDLGPAGLNLLTHDDPKIIAVRFINDDAGASHQIAFKPAGATGVGIWTHAIPALGCKEFFYVLADGVAYPATGPGTKLEFYGSPAASGNARAYIEAQIGGDNVVAPATYSMELVYNSAGGYFEPKDLGANVGDDTGTKPFVLINSTSVKANEPGQTGFSGYRQVGSTEGVLQRLAVLHTQENIGICQLDESDVMQFYSGSDKGSNTATHYYVGHMKVGTDWKHITNPSGEATPIVGAWENDDYRERTKMMLIEARCQDPASSIGFRAKDSSDGFWGSVGAGDTGKHAMLVNSNYERYFSTLSSLNYYVRGYWQTPAKGIVLASGDMVLKG